MTDLVPVPFRVLDDAGECVGLGALLPHPFEAAVVGWVDPSTSAPLSVGMFVDVPGILATDSTLAVEFVDVLPDGA